MASRRIVSDEKTILDRDDAPALAPGAQQPSNISPAVPASVIIKLLAFTFAMITVPIGTYFITVKTVFKGNSTYAGGLAAIMANVVLIAYVIVAMMEDQSERLEAEEREKKSR